MSVRPRRLLRWVITAAAALAFIIAPTAVLMSSDDGSATQAGGCYNGVPVLNPYVQSCTLPGAVNKIRGSAPDANAIIACRHHPGCLSWYVNNP